MLITMKEMLDRASKENYGVAAPNVAHELDARAVLQAAEMMNAPIILDVADGATPDIIFYGKYVTQLAEKAAVPVAINLDHGSTYEEGVAAIAAGFTSIMVDRSTLPYEENVAQVRDLVKVAHALNVSVEAELGHVGQGASYAADRDAGLTKPEQAVQYIKDTGIDMLAVAIGTAHGEYVGTPHIDFDRLVEIKKATNGFPLVLHGGSGSGDENLKKACQLGINKVNIYTDLAKAAVRQINEDGIPGMIWKSITDGIVKQISYYIELFGGKDKAWKIENKGLGFHEIDTTEK
mgnify:FL=1